MVQEKTNTAKEVSEKLTNKDDPWMQKISENKTDDNEIKDKD